MALRFQFFQDGIQEDEDALGLKRLGHFIKYYKDEFFWWEVFRTSRKLLALSIISVSRPAGIVVQAQLTLLLFIVSAVLQAYCQPFKEALPCAAFGKIGK